jgi:hypothetical protein
MGAKKTLQEGDCFAVPLPSGGFAIGVVARAMERSDSVIFVYMFGPRRMELPDIKDAKNLRPVRSIFHGRVGAGRRWSNLGRLADYSRSQWPMPSFLSVDLLTGRTVVRTYDDDDPSHLKEERALSVRAAARRGSASTTSDGLFGPVALEVVLNDLLGDPKATGRSHRGGIGKPRG